MFGGYWLPSNRCDPRAIALYLRHYSSEKGGRKPSLYTSGFTGNGESMVLLTERCDAGFAWRCDSVERADHQSGTGCTFFRNEGKVRSSLLIEEADDLAWRRWPGERHFTYVWDAKVKSSNPGYCFKMAGWRTCGRNKDGRLTILERLP